jgi:hypothetical protein
MTQFIFERNPDTGEIFRRKFMDNKREKIMEMVSLYDYLGRAAGPDLGKQVATAAAKAGVKSEIREVSNIKYTGPIMLYPKSFLDLYFKGGLNESKDGKQMLFG